MEKNSIIYVTKDRERAEGMPEDPTYSILSGKGEDTIKLLENSDLPRGSMVVVFKNSFQIEKIAGEKGWKLLNPSAELSERVENKITQVAWLEDLSSLLPPHHISLMKKIVREDADENS